MDHYAFIQHPEEVEAFARRLKRERVISLDTEADSFFHYFDKLCLVQVGYSDGIALIDPLALPDGGLAPLAPILADENVRKVLHAADYDLYVLSRHSGFKLRNLFDTMISAQLLGYPAVGLAALVERHFDVSLSKDQQRTDWSRRPLRPAQIEYAASDVRYLIELATRLERELRRKKRLEWARAEFRALEEKVWPEREFDCDGYMRIKGAKQLAPRNMAILRELYLMRDRRARALDRPPFKVLGNGTLLDLAKNPPRSKRSLSGRRGVTELVIRRFGQDIVDAVRAGNRAPEVTPGERKRAPHARRRLDRRAEARLEVLKDWRARRARELDLDPGVFCPNITLEEIAWANPRTSEECQQLAQAKSWWVEGFASEAIAAIRPLAGSGDRDDARSRRAQTGRSGRGGSGRKRRSGGSASDGRSGARAARSRRGDPDGRE